jgi:hypothetical protein
MKYEGLSKYLVKLNQWFVIRRYASLILSLGHGLCPMTNGKN